MHKYLNIHLKFTIYLSFKKIYKFYYFQKLNKAIKNANIFINKTISYGKKVGFKFFNQLI